MKKSIIAFMLIVTNICLFSSQSNDFTGHYDNDKTTVTSLPSPRDNSPQDNSGKK